MTTSQSGSTQTTSKLPAAYFTIATAGHVDHGKTSLIKALTGINPDRLKEEQERQMTTDLGFAHLLLSTTILNGVDVGIERKIGLGFIDVPGHGKFIKNMLAGVGGIEVALLVVAADEGPMPQTVQHIKILTALGVTKAVVALTKSDLVEASRVQSVEAKVRTLLLRFAIDVVGLVSVSSTTGSGIEALKSALTEVFSTGKRGQSQTAAGYLPIDRVFAKPGYGTVVTGTLVEGSFNVGDLITVEPGSISARVRGLETFGQTQELAQAGQRLAINLSIKDNKAVLSRGLCVLGGVKNVTNDLLVEVFDYGIDNSGDSGGKVPSLAPRPVKLYHGTMESAGHLRWLEPVENFPQSPIGHVHLETPIVVSPGDRYVIRYGDEGIAGGVVLLCQKPRWLTRKLVKEFAADLLKANDTPISMARAVLFLLNHHPGKAMQIGDLNWLVRDDWQVQCRDILLKDELVENLGSVIITRSVKTALKAKLIAGLNNLLKNEDKNVTGVNLETVRRMVAPHLERQIVQDLIKELGQEGLLVRKDDRLFGPGGAIDAPTLDTYTSSILKLLDDVLCLEITELARLSNSDPKQVKAAIERLAKVKMAQIVSGDFAASKKWIELAHQKLFKIWQEKKDISPADFRDALTTTRKYALALLGYFDDNQFTRRTTNGRVLLKQPKN